MRSSFCDSKSTRGQYPTTFFCQFIQSSRKDKWMLNACLCVVFSLMTLSADAQQATCVTPHLEDLKQRLAYNQSMNWQVAIPNAIQYVPLKFHLVANTDGTERIPEIQVLDMLCILNDKYEDQDIQFYFLDGTFNYIDDSGLNHQPNANTSVLKQHRIPNAINVFITKNTGIFGGAGYYQSPAGWDGNDFIVVAKEFVYAQNVLPHEIGHFFSLLHPFHGWENNPWDQQAWGNPVGTFAPSDPTLFSEPVLNERQDGSNCTMAADLICDTPPDYLFAQHPNQIACSDWFIPVQDPGNMVVNPMENNVMSYFNACGNYDFTAGQKSAILNDLMFSPDRAYIRNSYIPDLTPIQEVPNLLFPANGSEVPSTDQVILSWIPVLTADFYVAEIDVSPSFTSVLAQSKTVPASVPSAIFENLAGNQQYYWRVRPYKEYVTCTGLSDQWSFTTPASTAITTIAAIDEWTVLPNPMSTNAPLHLKVRAIEAFRANIAVFRWNGQLLYRKEDYPFLAGEQQYNLAFQLPHTGTYIIQIQNEKGTSSQKLVVLN